MKVTVTTKSGYTCTFENDDIHLLRLLRKATNDNLAMLDAADYMLGEEQMAALEEHCKAEDGHTSAVKVFEEIQAIFEASKEAKNS